MPDPLRAKVNWALNEHLDKLEEALLNLIDSEDFWEEWGDGQALRRHVCDQYGHDMINDHCGRPEHMHCSTCFAPVEAE